MIYLKDADTISEKTACALGLFDGVHRGHQLVIGRACEYKKQGLKPAVFTFETDTVTTKGHDGKIEMILTDKGKQRCFEKLGVQYLFSPRFTDYKDMSCEDFVRRVLKEKLCCERAVCGTDFRFGKGAKGDCGTLCELGEKYGIKVDVIRQLCDANGVISSTVIRSAIRCGEIEMANEMLGYTFFIQLPVETGQRIARTLEHPTINQRIPKGQILPRFGVYCTRICFDGKWYAGVTNIGIKPTFNAHTSPLAETYIIGFDGDLYGQTVTVYFDKFVRPEKKFADAQDLKKQIDRDTSYAHEYFKAHKIHSEVI
ncbi:MAG: riboflavin biosynthesis protein RibF [Ruminococcus sp.]|nr:riboflavin biosynthesis protein RibF [Ruminococcus sp.]